MASALVPIAEPNAGAVQAAATTARLASIDTLRGLVIVVMALDHVRDFFGAGLQAPEDLATTTPVLFGTRWITHFCAPVFSLLAGTGAYLQIARGKPRREVAAFLVKRGLFLMLVDATFISLVWQVEQPGIDLATLWSLGVAMIALAGLLFLPTAWVGTVALAILASHNLLDAIHARDLGQWAWLWSFLHEKSEFTVWTNFTIVFYYPVLPWIGVMAAGYCMGAAYLLQPLDRRRLLIWAGVAMMAAFVVLRWTNAYGDPSPWVPQQSAGMTALSFARTTKYPPSLLFVLMTLGPALVALAWIEPIRLHARHPLLVYGGTPMFFYVVHAALLPVLAFAMIAQQTHRARFPLVEGPPAGAGLPLTGVYLVWIFLVVALYWPCRLFGEYKRGHPEMRWLRYL
jgi:uncharacterized membrane protein